MSLMGGALPGGSPSEGTIGGLDLWQVKIDPQALAGYPTSDAGGLLMGKGTDFQITGYDGLGLPGQRNVDVPLSDDHGVRALGDFYQGRTITLGVAINHSITCSQGASGQAQAASDAFDDLRKLAGWWQARSADVVMELRWTNGQTYLVTGRPRNLAEDTTKLYRGIITVALSFLATDPRYYNVDQSSALAVLQATPLSLQAPVSARLKAPLKVILSEANDALVDLEADLDVVDEFLLQDVIPGENVITPTPDRADADTAANWIELDLNTIEEYLNAPVTPPPEVVTPPPGGLCLTAGVAGITVLCVPAVGGFLCAPVVENGNGTAFNHGNTATLPKITLFGDYTNPQLINATTGRTIKFVGTFTGQVLTVDMGTREVSLDGTPRFDLLGSQADFWDLIPGANEIHLRQTATTEAQARIDWRDAWL